MTIAPFRVVRVSLALLSLGGAVAAQALPAGAARRETLRLAERQASSVAAGSGLASALGPILAKDGVLLLEGAVITRGHDAVLGLLQAQPVLSDLRLSWEPFRVLVSSDGSLGVTFGATLLQRPGAPPQTNRYIAVWRRDSGGAWRLAALMQNGLLGAGDVVLSAPGSDAALHSESLSDRFSAADLAFARMAGDSGAPAAFFRFVAPDGMTLAGTGELNIGPANVRARLAEGRVAAAKWSWRPRLSFAASSGDLGATIGEATIRFGDGASDVSYSKYLTIWQRQPDGTLKFVVDGGNSRPPGE